MMETLQERSRRKFIAGALDQAAGVLGGLAGGVMVASVVAPAVTTAIGPAMIEPSLLVLIAVTGFLGGIALLCAALYCKGLAKQMDDDQLIEKAASPGD